MGFWLMFVEEARARCGTIFFALICFFLPFSKMSSFSDTCDLLVRVVALVLAETQEAVSSSSLSSIET